MQSGISSSTLCQPALVVYYDDYHTPLGALEAVIGPVEPVCIAFGSHLSSLALDNRLRAVDRRVWYADRYLSRAIRADARYQEHYNLSAALARPALAEAVSALVRDDGHGCVVHGFAGNDRLRFEAALATLNPATEILAVSDVLGSRTQANANGYTRSANIWGETLEAGGLGDPAFSSADLVFAAAEPSNAELTIDFSAGLPIAIDGRALELAALIDRLTAIGAAAGVARHDLVEDGMVGLKTRALYFNPAADILAAAHADLVRFTSSRREIRFRALACAAWADLVYDGCWFDPLRETLDAYFLAADRYVTGSVRVALRGGQIRVVARTSPGALYDEAAAVYRAGEDFGQTLIAGLRDQSVQLGRLAIARHGEE